MKLKIKLICILLVIATISGIPIVSSAKATTPNVNVAAGDTATVKFSYNDIVGINGTFTFSNPDLFTKVEVSVSNMSGFFNPENGKVAYFSAFQTDTVITLTLTVAKDAKLTSDCVITFEYEADVDGNLPAVPVYEYDVATVTVGSQKVNYTDLLAQIKRAEALKEKNYTAASWKKMQTALKAAKAARTSDDQAEVDKATKNLKSAIDKLVRVNGEVDYEELLFLIESAEALNEYDYTEASWAVLEDALENAKECLNSTSQSKVDKAASTLKNAITNLVRRDGGDVDYSDLLSQIATASILSENDYTKESWQLLMEALLHARSATSSLSQAEVDAAAAMLRRAIEGLVKIDISALLDAIAQVQALGDKSRLTSLWLRMSTLLARAEQLMINGDQASIDECTREILALLAEIIAEMESLKKTEIVEVEKEVPIEPDDDYCNIGGHKVWPILFWISFSLNVIGVTFLIIVLCKKKKKVSDKVPLVNYDIEDDVE